MVRPLPSLLTGLSLLFHPYRLLLEGVLRHFDSSHRLSSRESVPCVFGRTDGCRQSKEPVSPQAAGQDLEGFTGRAPYHPREGHNNNKKLRSALPRASYF